MDKQSLSSLEKYEKFRGLDSKRREIRELGNGRQQVIYKNQAAIHRPILHEAAICKKESNFALKERKQALKNKLTQLQKVRKTK